MTNIDPIKYWKDGADDALDTAIKLIDIKKYNYSLFFSHLALEKIIKALFVYTKKEAAPVGHNLVVLCERTGIPLSKDEKNSLDEISKFNISARYDDYKLQFYKKATKEFTLKWIKTVKVLYKKLSTLFT